MSQEDRPFYFTKHKFISGDVHTKYFKSTYILRGINFFYFVVKFYILPDVTAVCTVTRGYSDDGTLCCLDWGSRPLKMLEGGGSEDESSGEQWKMYSIPFPL